MPAAGTTGELYKDADNPSTVLGATPTAPVDVPPPTKVVVTQPVTTKARMADEKPDGTVRDTSTEAMRPGNDLGFRNLDQEPKEESPKEESPKPAEIKPPEIVPEKVYAGKFKSPEELEKGYLEAQKAMHKAMEEKAALEREKLATPQPAPPVKTPQQIAAEEAEKNKILNEFVTDPNKFLEERDRRNTQQTQVALAAQQVRTDWMKNNPDLAEHEFYVASEALRLTQNDPELAKDPARLIETATANFRQVTGKLRTEGAKEALTQETRTIPLLSNTAPTAATEQPAKAPLTSDDAFQLHLKMLKEQEQRSHRGLRR